jgi:hypothetical protein
MNKGEDCVGAFVAILGFSRRTYVEFVDNEKEVLEQLENRIKTLQVRDKESGIIQCYHYIEKRLEHMNYKVLLNKQLPIESGDIREQL